MKDTETRERFILLRAAGYSYRRISTELGISPSTAKEWGSNYYNEIDNYKADELTALYEQYNATKQERIKKIGENIRAIERVMQEKDVFNNLKPGELLNYHIKYLQLLKAEYEPQDPENKSWLDIL